MRYPFAVSPAAKPASMHRATRAVNLISKGGIVLLLLMILQACATTPDDADHDLEAELEQTALLTPPAQPGTDQPLPPLLTDGLSAAEINTVDIYRNRIRAVVHITAVRLQRTQERGAFPVGGVGSGFIIDQDGTVVTNQHVVQGAQRLLVTLYDGSRYPAELIGEDPEMDLAVIRFLPGGRELSTIPRGDSTNLQVGQQVLALGNPFGLDGTLTSGVVSALNRPMRTSSGYIMRELIQSDAAINPGNSGGPLLNSRGELVGVNSMMVSPSRGSVGIGLSIPSNTVDRIVTHIIKEGRVNRGWIAIEGITVDRRLATDARLPVASGVLVTRLVPEGNAVTAGLRDGEGGRVVQHGPYRVPVEGDIIVAINGEPIRSVGELFAELESTRPDDDAVLTVLRGSATENLAIRLTERPDDPPEPMLRRPR